jgi:peroxin-5
MDLDADPLARAIDFLNEGRTNEAILAFESQLKRHPDAETWRVLGKILQEQDQDVNACACLNHAYKL